MQRRKVQQGASLDHLPFQADITACHTGLLTQAWPAVLLQHSMSLDDLPFHTVIIGSRFADIRLLRSAAAISAVLKRRCASSGASVRPQSAGLFAVQRVLSCTVRPLLHGASLLACSLCTTFCMHCAADVARLKSVSWPVCCAATLLALCCRCLQAAHTRRACTQTHLFCVQLCACGMAGNTRLAHCSAWQGGGPRARADQTTNSSSCGQLCRCGVAGKTRLDHCNAWEDGGAHSATRRLRQERLARYAEIRARSQAQAHGQAGALALPHAPVQAHPLAPGQAVPQVPPLCLPLLHVSRRAARRRSSTHTVPPASPLSFLLRTLLMRAHVRQSRPPPQHNTQGRLPRRSATYCAHC